MKDNRLNNTYKLDIRADKGKWQWMLFKLFPTGKKSQAPFELRYPETVTVVGPPKGFNSVQGAITSARITANDMGLTIVDESVVGNSDDRRVQGLEDLAKVTAPESVKEELKHAQRPPIRSALQPILVLPKR